MKSGRAPESQESERILAVVRSARDVPTGVRYDIEIVDRGTDGWREDQPSVMRTRELDEYQIFELWKEGLRTISCQMRKPLHTRPPARPLCNAAIRSRKAAIRSRNAAILPTN